MTFIIPKSRYNIIPIIPVAVKPMIREAIRPVITPMTKIPMAPNPHSFIPPSMDDSSNKVPKIR